MLNLHKKILIFVFISVVAIISTFTYATSLGHNGCCMDPPCKECYENYGFCVCEFKEKIGLDVCNECKEHGCGTNENHLHEMMMEEEPSSCGFH